MSPDLILATQELTRKTDFRAKAISPQQFEKITVTTMPGWGSSLTSGGSAGAFRGRPYQIDVSIRWFSGIVYTCAMLNAKAFASVPLRMYVRRRQGQKMFGCWQTRPVSRKHKAYLAGKLRRKPSKAIQTKTAGFGDDYEELTTPHPAIEVLSAANPWQNGFDLAVLRCLYKQITGNSYLFPVIDKRLGVPTELWIAPSQLVKIIPDETGKDWIKGYKYGNEGNMIQFGPNELIQFKYPSLVDPLYGMGKVEAMWSALQVQWGKRQNDIAMFENGARPDWLLIIKDGGPTDLDRVEAAVDAKFRGPRKAGQFMAINGNVDAKPLQLTPKEIGDYPDILEEIAAGFGVPISKLKANDPNYSNAETADDSWLRDTILPECRDDEEQLNARYLPLFGVEDDSFLAYDDPIPENEEAVADEIRSDYAAGIADLNETRARRGMDLVPEDQNLRVAPMGAMLVNSEHHDPRIPPPGTDEDIAGDEGHRNDSDDDDEEATKSLRRKELLPTPFPVAASRKKLSGVRDSNGGSRGLHY